jgi:hypothetical protein
MSYSVLKQAQLDARHGSNVAWRGEQIFEELKIFADEIALNAGGTNVARTAASGGLALTTGGVATFQLTQAAVLAAGDYITITRGGVAVKYQVISGSGTGPWQLSPAPTTAYGVGNVTIVDDGATSTSTFATAPGFAVGDKFFTTTGGIEYTVTAVLTSTTFTTTPDTAAAAQAYGISYVPVNQLSYWDFPIVLMPGVRPIPEGFRMRFGGTGTATAATFQFVRVNAVTGVETPITTAVATTSAAVWVGVDVTPFGEEPQFTSSSGATPQYPIDEIIRLVCTAKTTLTTGRTLLVEMQLRRATGPNCYSATP